MAPVPVTIETPRHSSGKYNFDPKERCYRLKKLLPLGMYFPYDFGFINNTLGDDGDPLDALVITECDTYPGVELPCRIIGAVLATQHRPGKKKMRNDRYLFIPLDSLAYGQIKDIRDFSRIHNTQLLDFFINYNKAEGKIFNPFQIVNSNRATQLLGKQLH